MGIKKWHMVAAWKWDVNDEVCGICRMAFDACCPECTLPGDGCPPSWGACHHAFHMHCILKWIQRQNVASDPNENKVCPMCRQVWEFKRP